MVLRTFEKADYSLLIDWIDSDKLNYQWCGPNFEFPLDFSQINKHCAKPEVFPFIFGVAGQSDGYVELFKVSESHFRICRVFVSDSFLGKGLAKVMLKRLIELAKEK